MLKYNNRRDFYWELECRQKDLLYTQEMLSSQTPEATPTGSSSRSEAIGAIEKLLLENQVLMEETEPYLHSKMKKLYYQERSAQQRKNQEVYKVSAGARAPRWTFAHKEENRK